MTRQQLLFGERLRKRRKALHYTQEYVAEQVGINDYNYFSKVFRSITGATPSAFRKQFRS